MTDALKRLSDEGVAIWLDDLSRKRITSGNLAELIDQQHVVGVTTNPSIFQKAIGSGRRLRAAARRPRRPQGHRRRGRPHDHDGGRPRRRRHPAPGLRRDRRPGRPGLHRGRPAPGARHRGDRRRGQAAGLAGGPPEHAHQDPGDQGRPAGDHRGHRPGHQRQRHADLLAGALPRGHGRLPGGPGEGARPRAWTSPRSTRWRPSSCPAWTPRSTSGWTPLGTDEAKAAQGQGRARQRPAGLRGVRGGLLLRPLGRPGQGAAPTSSARCGPRPASRTRRTRTPCTSTTWSRPTRSTPCRRPPWRPPPTTARSPATPSPAATTQARADLDAVEKLGISYDDVVQLLEDEGVEKFEASWNDLLKSTEAELERLAPSEG